MTGPVPTAGDGPGDLVGRGRSAALSRPEPASLADVLERVLDKGIVIAGDIKVNLVDVELLTIRLRLLVASVDRAREMGIDWWEHDPMLSSRAPQPAGPELTGGEQGTEQRSEQTDEQSSEQGAEQSSEQGAEQGGGGQAGGDSDG